MSLPDADLPVLTAASFLKEWKDGVAVLVDKPKDWSSFKVIRVLRSFTGIRRIGHAGTLDPMATGLLICCIGRTATRRIDSFMGLDKVYEGCLRLGETTPSYDAETPVDSRVDVPSLSEDDVRNALHHFTGEVRQKSPMYSAVKVGGERLYKLARRGVSVETPDRLVTIHSVDLLDLDGRDVRFRVSCSKGTYIRTLAHDVGIRLGVGAHLVALRRTAIGRYSVDDAVDARTLLTSPSNAG